MTKEGIDHVFSLAILDPNMEENIFDPEKRVRIFSKYRSIEHPVSDEEIDILKSLGAVKSIQELTAKYLQAINPPKEDTSDFDQL